IQHFRPIDRTAERAMNKDHRNSPRLVRLHGINAAFDDFMAREKLLQSEPPNGGIVQRIGQWGGRVNRQRDLVFAQQDRVWFVTGIKLQGKLKLAAAPFLDPAVDAQKSGYRHSLDSAPWAICSELLTGR